VIRCESAAFTYPDGTPALRGIGLSIEPGERVAITGPNGSGKSTLVRLWNGLLRPTAGSVSIDGRPTAGRRVAELSRIVALTFQDPTRQLFRRTCRDEVAVGARNAGLRGSELSDVVTAALEQVGLLQRAGTNPYDLGPSKQRLLTVACAIAMRPKVLVLDEPTKGLDGQEIATLARLIGSASRPPGQVVVAISHDARFVAASFERAIRLEAGRVTADGLAADVLRASGSQERQGAT
jgi:energy-coupling factor transporter ATP-binding protein EcfA2